MSLGSIVAFFIWQDQKDITIYELLIGYVKDYNVVGQQEDGKTELIVTAPDFIYIFSNMDENFNSKNISLKDINNEIRKKSTPMKDYTLFVKKIDEESIIKSLSSQISYELSLYSIENIIEMEQE